MKIEFHRSPKGESMPMQRVRSVYIMGTDLLGHEEMVRSGITDGQTVLISHFEVCPKADDFSGRKG